MVAGNEVGDLAGEKGRIGMEREGYRRTQNRQEKKRIKLNSARKEQVKGK